MQPAKLDDNSPGARIYRLLKDRGDWTSNIDIVAETRVIAPSTWVSAIRMRLAQEPWRGECVPPSKLIGGVHHYRIEQVKQGQLELCG